MAQIPPGIDLYQIPWQQPPPGVQSDFVKDSNLLVPFRIIIPIMIFFTTTFMILRIWARSGRDEHWKLDDWLNIAAWVSTTGLGLLLLNCVQKLGRATWDISIGTLTTPWPERIIVCLGFTSALSLLLGKLCLLALYYRFLGHIDRIRHQIYWTTALCFPLLAACIIFPVLSAPPPGKPWGTPSPYNNANSITAMIVGIENLIVDVLIFYIPIPPIISMNLSRRRKAGVLAIFSAGLMAIFTDAIVMYYRVRVLQKIDLMRDGMIVALCSFVEACVSVVCGSMPCGAKVWKTNVVNSSFYSLLRSRFGSTQNTSPYKSSDGEKVQTKPPKTKRRGPYSIATLPTTHYSTTRLSQSEGLVELRSDGDGDPRCNYHMNSMPDIEARGSHENPRRPSLTFHDPSNYLRNSRKPI